MSSSLTSSGPLDLIYTDVWTSPVYSIDGYKYYVVFVDHFTRYVWLYPLKKKIGRLNYLSTVQAASGEPVQT